MHNLPEPLKKLINYNLKMQKQFYEQVVRFIFIIHGAYVSIFYVMWFLF